MSQKLMQERILHAQTEIDRTKEAVGRGIMRQRYHFMPQTGWMNDPNGLIYFRGAYHYFFQFNPYCGFWDSMHWGHAVSKDLLHWEYLPLALAPSESYDAHQRGGCFSGSAIEHNGRLYLIYTGCANHGRGFEQTQCVAWSDDGIHFEKYAGNPVITAPEGVSPDCFRDPKVWKQGDQFYLVCGAGRHGRGCALLYRSEDLLHWTFCSVLAESRGEWGYMWECPDFFPVGDQYVLTTSPMGAGDHTSIYMIGDFDQQTGRFFPQVCQEMDWGFDYYAPQSFLAPDGRRLVVSWANGWEWMPLWKDWGPTYQEGWCGFFNVPREVRMTEDHQLQFVPAAELQALRRDHTRWERATVTGEPVALPVGDGISFELKLLLDMAETDAEAVELHLRCGEGRETVCTVDLHGGELRVDRSNSDGWSVGVSRSGLRLSGRTVLDLHILSDQSSLELFADQYRNNHSNNIYATPRQTGAWICARGGRAVLRQLESWQLDTVQ